MVVTNTYLDVYWGCIFISVPVHSGFISRCPQKRSPDVVNIRILSFDRLPFLFSILKIFVKGPKCEWGRLRFIHNLPTYFHAAKSWHVESSARMSGSPSHIYHGLQNMWAGSWQNPEEGNFSSCSSSLPSLSWTWHLMNRSLACLHLRVRLE